MSRNRNENSRKERMFYLRLSVSAAIIISAVVLKWTAAPVDSPINSVIDKSINGGLSYNDTLNALGRVISGEKDVVEVFNDLTRADTEPEEEIKEEPESEIHEEADVDEAPTEVEAPEDTGITKDYYINNLAAVSQPPDVECLSFQMSEEELIDDTQPVPFMIPPPSNCSYEVQKLGFKYNAPLYGVVTSGFGYRDHPFGGDASFHTGIDIAAKRGSTVKAFAAGKVAEASANSVYGKYVLISHPNGFYSFYGHNSKITVKKGTRVNLGDKIAEVGSTGVSTGPHLHFEVRKGSVRLNPKHYISPDCV